MKKVLIVEDDSDWRLLLSMIVRRSGYDAISATNGSQAVALAALKHPDLILMDLGLPEMSGDEATAQIKGNPSTKDIPVVVQTAFGSGPVSKRALEVGAAEIMQKPISISQIQIMLKRYLSDEAKAPTVNYPSCAGQTIHIAP
jgi:CheY-like chemotaxis protein